MGCRRDDLKAKVVGSRKYKTSRGSRRKNLTKRRPWMIDVVISEMSEWQEEAFNRLKDVHRWNDKYTGVVQFLSSECVQVQWANK